MREQQFHTGVVEINYAEGPPAGPPIVLLHGVTRRWVDFLPILPTLLLRWQVFALDFRGHGQSDRTPGQYRVIDYVSDSVANVSDNVLGFFDTRNLLGYVPSGVKTLADKVADG